MISHARDVTAYVAEVPAARRAAIKKLRSLCRKSLKGYREGMEYGLPCYKKDGVPEISFANQKQYIALYVLKKDVLDEFRTALSGASIGKGCIRFKKPEAIDFSVVEQFLLRNAKSRAEICP
jgi:uncharacterized protein YdhG (YjbR/CyaY superfamily)